MTSFFYAIVTFFGFRLFAAYGWTYLGKHPNWRTRTGFRAPYADRERRLISATDAHMRRQIPSARTFSTGFGEKIKTKPCPLTKAAKLETQNGIRNSRNRCQKSKGRVPSADELVLMINATPTITL